jgi:hypothetical protein
MFITSLSLSFPNCRTATVIVPTFLASPTGLALGKFWIHELCGFCSFNNGSLYTYSVPGLELGTENLVVKVTGMAWAL